MVNNVIPETDEYGISSFVYRARRPFHPQRLLTLIEQGGFQQLLRSKGFFWLAPDRDTAYYWSQVASQGYFQLAGQWWAAEPRENWPEDADMQLEINDAWAEPYGDRRQEIACIGQQLDKAAMSAALDGCLLTDAEMADWSCANSIPLSAVTSFLRKISRRYR